MKEAPRRLADRPNVKCEPNRQTRVVVWSLNNHGRVVLWNEVMETEYTWAWEGKPRVLYQIEALVAMQMEMPAVWWRYTPGIHRPGLG